MSTSSPQRYAVIAGVIGAVVTVVLYWINLAIFGEPLIEEYGLWITVLLSGFFAAYIPVAIRG